jgi:hypothetical protein
VLTHQLLDGGKGFGARLYAEFQFIQDLGRYTSGFLVRAEK